MQWQIPKPHKRTYALVTTTGNTPTTLTKTTTIAMSTEEHGQINQSDASIFKTSKPDSAFREEIVVEVNSIDGECFRGPVTTKVAIKNIFMGRLGFSKTYHWIQYGEDPHVQTSQPIQH